MRATVDGNMLADSNDVVSCGGYDYFPARDVRTGWLEKAEKTADDLRCPHGVQFYDVVIGARRYPRAAWMYEAPQASLQSAANRFGFWKDVAVG